MSFRKIALNRARLFINDCNNLPIKINKAIVFGSAISGKANKYSDIDLAVFSDDFTDNVLHNIDLIGKVNIAYPDIDIHTYPLQALQQNSIMLQEIFATGIEVTP